MPPDSSSSDGARPPSGHVRPPKQERSRRTLERIVEAARSLIAEGGLDALTVSRIVERADSSVGSFYARFDGKDDLLRYLDERIREEIRQRWNDAVASGQWEDLPLEGVVRSVVELLVRVHAEGGEEEEVLARRTGDSGRARADASLQDAVERDVRRLLLARRSEIDHPDPARAAAVAYRWAVGGIRELSSASMREGPSSTRWDRDAIVEEVTRGVTAYLGGSGRSAGGDGVEFFDVWQ